MWLHALLVLGAAGPRRPLQRRVRDGSPVPARTDRALAPARAAVAAARNATRIDAAFERARAGVEPTVDAAARPEERHDRALATQTHDPDGIPFFETLPYATTPIFDTEAVGPVRFNFQTSDFPDYDLDAGVDMQLILHLQQAEFFEASDCADVLDATNAFPALRTCYFSKREGRITLQKPLKRNTKYSLTITLRQPAIELPDVAGNINGFTLEIWFYQMRKIEYTKYPIEITMTKLRADHPDYAPEVARKETGYVSEFTLLLQQDDNLGATTVMKFGMKTVGTMDRQFSIDVVAHPTDLWNIGEPGNCPGYPDQALITGSTCKFRAFAGTSPGTANGFRIEIGNTPAENYEGSFSVRINNPIKAANMKWVAISVKDNDAPTQEINTRAKTVLLDRPVSVIGTPLGRLSAWEYSAVNAEQWVVLDVFPGSTIMPFRPSKDSVQGYAGRIIVEPAPGFLVVESMPPQSDPSANSFMGTWSVDKAANQWLLQLAEIAAFGSTEYRVRLHVKNSPNAGTAYAWRMMLVDATEPFAYVIAATRDVLGMPVSGAMNAVLAPMNQLMGSPNVLRFELTPESDMTREIDAKVLIIAPEGFFFLKRCPKFKAIVLPFCFCKGDQNSVELSFPEQESLVSGQKLVFEIEVVNPVENVPANKNYWTFLSRRANRLDMDVGTFTGFYLYPSEFKSVRVIPSSRVAGPQSVIVRFTPAIRVPFDDYIRIRAPEGVKWNQDNLRFLTTAAATDAMPLATRTYEVEKENWIKFQVAENLEAGFEYGISCGLLVPEISAEPNRWWVEQLRLTGRLDTPVEFIASKGGAGFRTQRLVDVAVIPYNIVREGWENPTTMIFETTASVFTQTTALGTVISQASLLVIAPPSFTFICPLSTMQELPPNSNPFPPSNCIIDHSNDAEKNKLNLLLYTGLEADTKYAFLIDVVNGPYVNPTTNFFTLMTSDNGVPIEDATVPGFALADPMMNTRYVPTGVADAPSIAEENREDRRVDVENNKVTFIFGTTQDMEAGSMLEFRAPENFTFPEDCEVGVADYVEVASRGPYPDGAQCYGFGRVAQVILPEPLPMRMYGLYVVVKNPTFTPLQTNWGIYLFNPAGEATMAEAWIQGFPIQEILDPHIEPYNPAKAIPGEAAPNPIDIWFTLTTKLLGGGIVIKAPAGFHFPQVCRYFSLNIARSDHPEVLPLPAGSECSADGLQTLSIKVPSNTIFAAGGTYGFRVLVEDPSVPFLIPDREDRLWSISTVTKDGDLVDINYKVVGFPVLDRLRYFSVQTLSGVGLITTTIKISFNLFYDLLPQRSIDFIAPQEFDFLTGRDGGGLGCADSVATDQERQQLLSEFGVSLFSDVSQLPEYMRCRVKSRNRVMLTNTDSERGGRMLFAGPTYEVLVTEVNNPQSTPALNLYRAIADTLAPFGPERWAFEGYSIFPELADTLVESSNPGYGLYTDFSFTFRTITPIPAGGSMQVTAPQDDFYFGPRLDTGETHDPLSSIPPKSGKVMVRPPPKQVIVCDVRLPESSLCPFGFVACREYEEAQLQMVQDPTLTIDTKSMQDECTVMQAACEARDLSDILSCQSVANVLELTLSKRAFVPGQQLVRLQVAGYNTLAETLRGQFNAGKWHFVTRNADSVKTPLDEKMVDEYDLAGVVYVELIEPGIVTVNEADNEVTVVFKLDTELQQPGVLRVTYPEKFVSDTGSNPRVEALGELRKAIKNPIGNMVEFILEDDPLPKHEKHSFAVFMSNPGISPPPHENIWKFETLSDGKRVDCNFDVPGFKIYGDFTQSEIAGAILAPGVHNIVGIWFKLATDLEYTSESYMRIWMPVGYEVESDCGFDDFKLEYTRIPNAKEAFPDTVKFVPLPSGSSCEATLDQESGQFYVLLKIDAMLEFGVDYAFQFGVTNPEKQPLPNQNVIRFETLVNGVILHLQRDIRGFQLERLKVFNIEPFDTTSQLPMAKLQITLVSDKNIPGGSQIAVYAPRGFVFTCAYFRTQVLASTTTCYTKQNLARFTVDSQDPKPPNLELGITVYATNPQFTPQPNFWGCDVISPLGSFVDTISEHQGYDITGAIIASVDGSFKYYGQRSRLSVQFIPSTIMNQADIGNEIVIFAPDNYRFPRNCTSFSFRFSNLDQIDQRYPNADQYNFPPQPLTCMGNDNLRDPHLIVRLPDGAGLLAPYNYTIEVEIVNPAFDPNANDTVDSTWQIVTRVRNSEIYREVDANRSFEPYDYYLQKLAVVEDDISSAPAGVLLAALLFFNGPFSA